MAKKPKSLKLHRETVRRLSDQDLKRAVGGVTGDGCAWQPMSDDVDACCGNGTGGGAQSRYCGGA